MLDKNSIREKAQKLRKKKYFEISESFFSPLASILKKRFGNKHIYLSLYHPANYEVDVLKIFDSNLLKKTKTLLPVITSKNKIKFVEWKNLDPLIINNFGILEPSNEKSYIPHVLLIPMLAYDNNNNRLGYGKGYYDKFLNKYLRLKRNILTIGIAFSFQKYNKLPISKFDVKLDYILTEKGIKK